MKQLVIIIHGNISTTKVLGRVRRRSCFAVSNVATHLSFVRQEHKASGAADDDAVTRDAIYVRPNDDLVYDDYSV